MADVQTTRLSRRWLLKISIFLIGLPVFGLLGLYDGVLKYPRRGERDASIRLLQFLETHPIFTKVEDSSETFSRLKARADEGAGRLNDEERALLEFLGAMNRLWRLNADTLSLPVTDEEGEAKTWDIRRGEAFSMEDGERRYDLVSETRAELKEYWDGAKKPAPLDSKFDIAFQWGLVVVCFGLWPWPISLVVKAARTKYRWDPDEQRLTLPDGTSFTPADIAELDKSKWHKFYVTAHLKDGRELTFDLLRFEPLEEWIVAMEKSAGLGKGKDGERGVASADEGEPERGAAAADKGEDEGGKDAVAED